MIPKATSIWAHYTVKANVLYVCAVWWIKKKKRGVNVGACWGREVSDEAAAARRHCNKLNVAEFRPTATVRMTRVSSLLNQWIRQLGADQRQTSLEFWILPFYDITWICLTKFNNNNKYMNMSNAMSSWHACILFYIDI